MRGADELALVVQLATLTEDRSPDEQRALMAVALRVDKERSRFTVTNPMPIRPYLFQDVLDTYEPGEGRPIGAGKANLGKFRRMVERFDVNVAEGAAAQHAATRAGFAASRAALGAGPAVDAEATDEEGATDAG